MASKLSNEQRSDVVANPHQAVPIVDEQSGKTYYIVDDVFLFGQVEEDEQSRQQLIAMIEDGFASGEVPEEEAHARMRATIEKYRT